MFINQKHLQLYFFFFSYKKVQVAIDHTDIERMAFTKQG
jgi:hypothetical protein